MDRIEKILWITMLSALLWLGMDFAFGEQRPDVYETLRLNHQTTPVVCVFEANPEITDDWENIERVTYEAIYEWKEALENESHLLFLPIYGTIEWESHANKYVSDYPFCNILINYEYYSGSDSLGTTSIDFSYSKHKFMFINIYLNQFKPTVEIVLSGTEGSVGYGKELVPMPLNTIRNVVLHEFGHGLGLGHYFIGDGIDGGKTMYDYSAMVPTIEAFDEELELTIRPNDMEMIRQLYADDGFYKYNPRVIPKSCLFLNNTLVQCNS